MCRKMVVVNKLSLGARELGWELLSLTKGEIVEMTSKQLKDVIAGGKDKVYGLTLDASGELIFDKENFFTTNMMNKSHINSLVPIEESDNLVNLFYIVIGTHNENGHVMYDVVSSRYERTSLTEEKLKLYIDMGVVSGGAKIENDKIIVADMENEKSGKVEKAGKTTETKKQ